MAEAPKTEMLDVGKLTGDTLEVTLIVALPNMPEKRYPMRATTMMAGRSDAADIAIKDPSVSSRHCEFEKQGGRLSVKDLGSSNGTFMNGERIQGAELNDGDSLRLGNSATVTVQISNAGAPPRKAVPAPAPDGAGSTMMISANDLNSMRAPPPPQRKPAMAPPPMPMQQAPAKNGKMGLIIGGVVALVVLVGGIVGVLVMKSNARKAQLALVEDIQKDVTGIAAQTPCGTVQDSVGTIIRLESTAGVSAPVPPARKQLLDGYQKFVDVQRDKARQFKRIIGTVEQFVATAQVTVERVKSDVGKITDDGLKARAAELAQALDERMALSQDFIGGWRKLQGETERYADLTESAFVKGGPDSEFQSFRFSKQAPQVLASCKSSHETSKKAIEEKLVALKELSSK